MNIQNFYLGKGVLRCVYLFINIYRVNPVEQKTCIADKTSFAAVFLTVPFD